MGCLYCHVSLEWALLNFRARCTLTILNWVCYTAVLIAFLGYHIFEALVLELMYHIFEALFLIIEFSYLATFSMLCSRNFIFLSEKVWSCLLCSMEIGSWTASFFPEVFRYLHGTILWLSLIFKDIVWVNSVCIFHGVLEDYNKECYRSTKYCTLCLIAMDVYHLKWSCLLWIDAWIKQQVAP